MLCLKDIKYIKNDAKRNMTSIQPTSQHLKVKCVPCKFYELESGQINSRGNLKALYIVCCSKLIIAINMLTAIQYMQFSEVYKFAFNYIKALH